MNDFPNLKNPIHFIATLGGIGKIPFAPGTWGSLLSFVLFIVLSHYIDMHLVVLFVILVSKSVISILKVSKSTSTKTGFKLF